MSKRVLVTGGAGFIGRESVRKLVTSGYDVICFDLAEQIARHRPYLDKISTLGRLRLVSGSVLDRSAVRQAVHGVEVVLHLAAMLGVKKTEDNKLSCIEINVNGTDNVLSAAVSEGVKKFILASSSEVYGEPNRNPIRETDDTKGKTVYAVTKLAGEELVKGYHQLYPSMQYTIIRFFNTYGEGQVAQFVLCKFVREVLAGRNPVVYGDGSQVRSYGHVDDVTEGVKRIIENPISNGQVYNLGHPEPISLLEIAQMLVDLCPGATYRLIPFPEERQRIDIGDYYASYAKIQATLGWAPRVAVRDGLEQTVAYYQRHREHYW
jgi:UDP-glucose 4-epimerase